MLTCGPENQREGEEWALKMDRQVDPYVGEGERCGSVVEEQVGRVVEN